MNWLQAIAAAISLACLLSLGIYVFLAERGNSALLFSTSANYSMRLKDKAFLSLAAIGLLVCVYQGAHSLLWWIPSNIGSVDEDGEYKTAASTLSMLFTFFVGFFLVKHVDSANHYRIWLKEESIKSAELEKIICSKGNQHELLQIQSNYKEKMRILAAAASGHHQSANGRICLEERMIFIYRDLLKMVESLLNTADNTTS